ncbi:response regulator transcription factor [bacterium]|nr:response regulator transcription factor [bacterium]
MYKHRATMTDRRYKILKLIAKGYKNKLIAKKLDMSLSNTQLQKWRLYCFLGDVHTAIDAVYMGLQMGLLHERDLSEAIREEIYDNENEKQMHRTTEAGKSNNRDIQTNAKIIPFPAKRVRAKESNIR